MSGSWTAAASIACLGAWSGCSFGSPRAASDAAPELDAAADAAPDAAVAPRCMTDPTYSPNGTHRYKVIALDVDYDTAIDACAADGAHLAVIDSTQENEYLATLSNINGVWIGLDDLTVEKTFEWITGSPVAFNGFPTGEPNDTGGEDCTLLYNGRTWNDAGCEYPRRPACECDPLYHPPPTPSCRTVTNSFDLVSGRRLFRRPAATWAQAKADCEAMGAYLLVIGDARENTEMNSLLPGAHWIGFTDGAAEGTFRWVNESPSTFHNWPGGTIPQDDGLDCAVLQDANAVWSNVSCDDTHPYACECDPLPP